MRSGVARLALTALLGALGALGFAPFGLFPLTLLMLAGLVDCWRQSATPRAAALSGFAFGLGFFLTGVSWVFVSMHDFGGMPAPLAAVATLLFCALLALFPAAAGYLFLRLKSGVWWRDALLAAAAWTFSEWLRGWVFTGFPWLAVGYAQTPPSPLAGFAPLLGVYGVSFLSMWLAALLALAWMKRHRLIPAAAIALVLLTLGFGLARVEWTQAAAREISVSLLQGNIEQSLKWKPELLQQSLAVYLKLARENPAQLIILPETALPTTFDQLPRDYLRQLTSATANGGDVLLGIVTRDEHNRYYNSAVGINASTGDLQRYSKSHLVPFGEFTPPTFAWTLALLAIPMSDFSRGQADQPPLMLAGEQVMPNICYEDVFGEEIIRALPQATLLINLSNTAWFGNSWAQPQHLQIAQMRALESGRVMLRATNTGMTAVVSPRGEIEQTLPPFTTGALKAKVRGHSGLTPYARWGNAGALLLVLLGLPTRLNQK